VADGFISGAGVDAAKRNSYNLRRRLSNQLGTELLAS
jgi:hypothetical protein